VGKRGGLIGGIKLTKVSLDEEGNSLSAYAEDNGIGYSILTEKTEVLPRLQKKKLVWLLPLDD